jgi:uncharacterized membrane protein YeiH
VLLGTITGIGGGLLRDILVGAVPPRTLQRGAPYASASLVGAALYVGLVEGLDVKKFIAQIATVILVLLIRGLSLWRGWETPGTRDLTPAVLRRDRAAGSEPVPPERGDDEG